MELNNNLESSFDTELNGNILIIGPSNSGKTSLVQNWSINSKFSKNIKKVYWVSSLLLEEQRKNEIDSYFSQQVNFARVSDKNEIELFIEDLKNISSTTTSNSNESIDENQKLVKNHL